MTLRTMYDAATPPAVPPAEDAVLVYAGGADATRIWTDADIASQGSRARMPTWVYGPEQNGGQDAGQFRDWLDGHGVPEGTAVLIDMETGVNLPYLSEMYDQLGRWEVGLYGSLSTLFANPEPDFWAPADWTGSPHLFAHDGVLMTQYAAEQLGQTHGPWDLSLLAPQLKLWNETTGTVIHEYVTTGGESLREIARQFRTEPSTILRLTVMHLGHMFHPGLADYLNVEGNINDKMPKGIPLVIQPGKA